MKKRKAISLMSGGLDSTLATKLVLDQGIDVIGLYLDSPFGCNENVVKVAKHLNIPLRIVPKGMDYIDLVRDPKYGYGKNMNPCIDCRIYMFIAARKVMDEEGADFIVTGEVLGQRPMSQRRDAMEIIDRDSEMESLILRPLSAKNMLPTLPELEGWVDREKLLEISGRGRGQQMEWAAALELKEYAAPGGGCLLTDANFSGRLSELFQKKENPTMVEFRLLRYGRHFDLSGGAHVIVGRDQEENGKLREESQQEVDAGRMAFFQPLFSGPVAVLSGGFTPALFEEVGKIILRYGKKGLDPEQTIEVRRGETASQLKVHSLSIPSPDELPMAPLESVLEKS
jgi:tRNA U34 2-thiouridine synthase MnmA/TrmU